MPFDIDQIINLEDELDALVSPDAEDILAHSQDYDAGIVAAVAAALAMNAVAGSSSPTGPAGGVLGGTYPNPSFASDMATQAELDAHVNDTSAAHAATAVAFTPAGTIAATTVQAAIEEVASEAGAATPAASAVVVDSTTLVGTGTNAQAVFEELDNAIVAAETATADHIADTSAAHAASSISADSTTLVGTGTTVQAVFEELDDAIATNVTNIAAAVPKSLYDANTILAATADNTPTALTIGASTFVGRKASGDITAMTVAEAMALIGGGQGYLVGSYYIHNTAGIVGTTTSAMTLNLLSVVPFVVRKTTTFDRIACFQGGNGTATTVHRLGIFNDTGNYYPGTVLLDAGTVAGDAGGSVIKEITISQQLTPGVYWLGHVNQTAAGGTTFNSSASSITPPWMGAPVGINGAGYTQASVTGALGTFTSSITVNATVTIMWLRAA